LARPLLLGKIRPDANGKAIAEALCYVFQGRMRQMMSEMSGKEKYEVVYVYASADPHLGFLYQF
jgi:hypothetical protein